MIRTILTTAAIAFWTGGCAGLTHELDPDTAAMPPGRPPPKREPLRYAEPGFYYYQSAPYLLVHSDGKGGLVWRILSLPDQSKRMVAKPHEFLASTDTSMKFKNGVLTEASVVGDGTAIGKAVIEAAKGVLSSALAADAPESRYVLPPLHLYKIEYAGKTARLYPADGAVPIEVTLARK